MPPLLTPDEVADRLQVSVWRVRRWIRAGSLPARRIGVRYYVTEAALARWIAQQDEQR